MVINWERRETVACETNYQDSRFFCSFRAVCENRYVTVGSHSLQEFLFQCGKDCPARVSIEWIWWHGSTRDLQAACDLTTAPSLSNVCLHSASLSCWSGLLLKVNRVRTCLSWTQDGSVKNATLMLPFPPPSVCFDFMISHQSCGWLPWRVVRKITLCFLSSLQTQNKNERVSIAR